MRPRCHRKVPGRFLGAARCWSAAALLAGLAVHLPREAAGGASPAAELKASVAEEIGARVKAKLDAGAQAGADGDLAAAAKAGENNTPPARKPRKTRNEMKEESLIESLLNCPLCKGKQAVACFKNCRYGEIKHTWRQCLEMCIDNHLLRSTFLMMLPSEDPPEQPAAAAPAPGGTVSGGQQQEQQPHTEL